MPTKGPTGIPKVTVIRHWPLLCPLSASIPPAASGGRLPKAPSTPIPSASREESHVSEVFTTITLDRLESLLDDHGIVAKHEQVEEKEFLKFNAGPFTALLFPYGTGPDFMSLQFRAGFRGNPPLGTVNTWNRENRYGKAYLDDDDEPVLEYDLDLEGGATESTIVEAVRTFRALVKHFYESILED